jgi:hypothetical protein
MFHGYVSLPEGNVLVCSCGRGTLQHGSCKTLVDMFDVSLRIELNSPNPVKAFDGCYMGTNETIWDVDMLTHNDSIIKEWGLV